LGKHFKGNGKKKIQKGPKRFGNKKKFLIGCTGNVGARGRKGKKEENQKTGVAGKIIAEGGVGDKSP